jgi:enoyl reductase-like protein
MWRVAANIIEKAVEDNRQGVALQLGDWARGYFLTIKTDCYEMLLHRASDLKIKENEMGRHVARVEDMRNAYRTLVRKPLGKRPLGR